jgi:hypothetical protein
MTTYKPFLDLILEHADYDQGNLKHVGLKAVNPDFTSRNGFRWAFPGHWTRDPADEGSHTTEVCPVKPGDGLSVAKTTRGMTQGGYQPRTVLVVGFNRVLAEDTDKWKVATAKTLAVVDGLKIIRNHGDGAYLTRAYLTGADLTRADLTGADLTGADLTGAYLTRAYGRTDWDALVARGAVR